MLLELISQLKINNIKIRKNIITIINFLLYIEWRYIFLKALKIWEWILRITNGINDKDKILIGCDNKSLLKKNEIRLELKYSINEITTDNNSVVLIITLYTDNK